MSNAISTIDRADVRTAVDKMTDEELWAAMLVSAEDVNGGRRDAKTLLRAEEVQIALLSRGLKTAWDVHYIAEWQCSGLL